MQSELRKLAQILREKKAETVEKKLVKCAQIVRGHIGLAILRRKLGKTL